LPYQAGPRESWNARLRDDGANNCRGIARHSAIRIVIDRDLHMFSNGRFCICTFNTPRLASQWEGGAAGLLRSARPVLRLAPRRAPTRNGHILDCAVVCERYASPGGKGKCPEQFSRIHAAQPKWSAPIANLAPIKCRSGISAFCSQGIECRAGVPGRASGAHAIRLCWQGKIPGSWLHP